MLIRNKIGKAFLAGLAAVFLATVLFTSVKLAADFVEGDFQIIFDDESDSNYTITEYTEWISPNLERARFIFDGGIGIFNLKRTTDDLIYVKAKGVRDNYKLIKDDVDSLTTVKLKMKEKKIHIGKSDYTNRVDISLNESPVWDLDIDVGAAEIDLDLKKFNIENIAINMGAASLDLKLGNLSESTNLDIDAGASNIDIFVPESAGCQVNIDDVLSSKKLSRFEKLDSGLYETAGFDEAEKKIYINIDCGVSSVTIRRYSD
jgi:hypothetical protein